VILDLVEALLELVEDGLEDLIDVGHQLAELGLELPGQLDTAHLSPLKTKDPETEGDVCSFLHGLTDPSHGLLLFSVRLPDCRK